MNDTPYSNQPEHYRGWRYLRAGCGYRLLFDSKPLVDFKVFKELEAFVDMVTEELDKHLVQWNLHLTGCKRCYRTMDGKDFSPCSTGGVMLVSAKGKAEQLATTAAHALKVSRGESKQQLPDREQGRASQSHTAIRET